MNLATDSRRHLPLRTARRRDTLSAFERGSAYSEYIFIFARSEYIHAPRHLWFRNILVKPYFDTYPRALLSRTEWSTYVFARFILLRLESAFNSAPAESVRISATIITATIIPLILISRCNLFSVIANRSIISDAIFPSNE